MRPLTASITPRIRSFRASLGSVPWLLVPTLCVLRALPACDSEASTDGPSGIAYVEDAAAIDASWAPEGAASSSPPDVVAPATIDAPHAAETSLRAPAVNVAAVDEAAPRIDPEPAEPEDDDAADVEAAAPPGGWFIDTTPAAPPSGKPLPSDARVLGDGVSIAPVAAPDVEDEECATHGVWAPIAGAPREVFTVRLCLYEEVVGGVWTQANERVVWLWNKGTVTLDVARLDAVTGERVAPSVHVVASSYLEIDCANVLEGLRPTPVRVGKTLGFALQWGGPELLYVAPGRRQGALLRAAFPVPAPDEEFAPESYPAALRLVRCGRTRCLAAAD